MSYLANKHDLTSFYPADAGQRGMVDSANFYLIGSLGLGCPGPLH